jgi:hypothetical protein
MTACLISRRARSLGWRRVLGRVAASVALSVVTRVAWFVRHGGPSFDVDPWGAQWHGTALQRWLLSWVPIREVFVPACRCDGDPVECSHEAARAAAESQAEWAEAEARELGRQLVAARLALAGRSDARRRQVARRAAVLAARRRHLSTHPRVPRPRPTPVMPSRDAAGAEQGAVSLR